MPSALLSPVLPFEAVMVVSIAPAKWPIMPTELAATNSSTHSIQGIPALREPCIVTSEE